MIEFRRVTKQFPDGTVAVEDVDIVIPPHKTTVLVGSSGSGKTTLLRMINRMVDPTGGQVLIDGTDVATKRPGAAAPRHRLRHAELGAAAAPQGDRQRGHRAAAPRHREARGVRPRPRTARHRRARPVARRSVPEPALGRPAAARRRRPRTRGRPEHPADGRAVRRRRPDRPRGAAAGAPPTAGRTRQDGGVRHARHRRGVPARRPGRHHAGRRQDLAGRVARPRSWRIRPTPSSPTSSGRIAASARCTSPRSTAGSVVVDADGRPAGVLAS